MIFPAGIDDDQGDTGCLTFQDGNAAYVNPVGPQFLDGADTSVVCSHRSDEPHFGARSGRCNGGVCSLPSAVAMEPRSDDCLARTRKVIRRDNQIDVDGPDHNHHLVGCRRTDDRL